MHCTTAPRQTPTAIRLLLLVLVALLCCCQEDKEVSAPSEPEVWEGEMVANPKEYEMTPNPNPKPDPKPKPPSGGFAASPLAPESQASPVPEIADRPAVPLPDPVKPAPKPVAPRTPEVRTLIGSGAADEKRLLSDLEATIENGEWGAYRQQLMLSIDMAVSQLPGRLDGEKLVALNTEPVFYTTLLRWKLLKLLPPGLWTSVADEKSFREFARHVFGEAEVMEQILMTVQPEDDVIKLLPMMTELWGSHSDKPQLAAKYFNLNLACALVFDQTVAYVNDQTQLDYGESGGVDARARYAWYVKQNERGYLEVSIERSSARDLTFVVCAPVTEAELDWAVKQYRSLRRKSWAKTYGEIEYLMERAVEGINPYESYTLQEIHKEGGICGDQTHFSVNTARAAGIPALGLSGTTNSGPHAWAAIKLDDDEWSTKIGRIGGVSNGRGRDPQTGKSISEQDIWMWSSREYRRASRRLELQRQLWLGQLFGELSHPEWQRMVIHEARRDGEPYPEYWEALYDSLKADPVHSSKPEDVDTLKVWKAFCDDLKREFRENPRMSVLAVTVEENHLFPHMELADIRRQLDRDRRRQQREAAEQADLATTSLKREGDWIMSKLIEQAQEDEDARNEAQANALREISQLYDRSLREYGKSVSGFATMAEDYFNFVKDDEKLAPKAVRDIELAFKRVVDTDSDDWFRAQTEVGLHKRICEMYRRVGEEKRADVMERRLETQMERARRKAL